MALSVNEISRLKQWIFALLSGDPEISSVVGKHPVTDVTQVYDRIAPEAATYPLIIFQFMPEADRRGGFGARIFSQGAFLVKAINQGTDESEIWPIADAIDTDLQDATALPAQSGLIVLGCSRDMIYNQASEDQGVQYNEIGGRYMVQFYMPGESIPGASVQTNLPPTPTVQEQLDTINQELETIMTTLKNPVMTDQVDAQVITGSATTSAAPLPVIPANKNVETYRRTLTANIADYAYATTAPGRIITQGFNNSAASAGFIWTINAQSGDVFNAPDLVAATSFNLANGETRTFVNTTAGVWDQI